MSTLTATPPVPRANRWLRYGWALFRLVFSTAGRLSAGIRLGYRHGFDSGTMLDYVYADWARGALGLGRLIDRAYLNAVGWRAIRARAALLSQVVAEEIRRRPGRTVRILDVAAGPGRYLLDTLAALPPADADRVRVLCRDLAADGLWRGRQMAAARGLSQVRYKIGDALDPAPAGAALGGPPDVIVVSGLYELILEAPVIRASIARLRAMLAPGGTLVFTTQVRHPQLELIANALRNRHGDRWVMVCRPAAETRGVGAGGRLLRDHDPAGAGRPVHGHRGPVRAGPALPGCGRAGGSGTVWDGPGRLAQRERASFTPKRSLVRSQYRPPSSEATSHRGIRPLFVAGCLSE